MPHFRPRLRFSLRTLFVLVTVLCVWLGYQLNWIRQRREALDWLNQYGGGFLANNDFFDRVETHPAPWSLRILGENGIFTFSVGDKYEKREAEELRRLFPEAEGPDTFQSPSGTPHAASADSSPPSE